MPEETLRYKLDIDTQGFQQQLSSAHQQLAFGGGMAGFGAMGGGGMGVPGSPNLSFNTARSDLQMGRSMFMSLPPGGGAPMNVPFGATGMLGEQHVFTDPSAASSEGMGILRPPTNALVSDIRRTQELQAEEFRARAAEGAAGFAVGTAGATAGAVVGASIGSVIPGLGTAVGAGVGAIAGMAVGAGAGEWAMDQIFTRRKHERERRNILRLTGTSANVAGMMAENITNLKADMPGLKDFSDEDITGLMTTLSVGGGMAARTPEEARRAMDKVKQSVQEIRDIQMVMNKTKEEAMEVFQEIQSAGLGGQTRDFLAGFKALEQAGFTRGQIDQARSAALDRAAQYRAQGIDPALAMTAPGQAEFQARELARRAKLGEDPYLQRLNRVAGGQAGIAEVIREGGAAVGGQELSQNAMQLALALEGDAALTPEGIERAVARSAEIMGGGSAGFLSARAELEKNTGGGRRAAIAMGLAKERLGDAQAYLTESPEAAARMFAGYAKAYAKSTDLSGLTGAEQLDLVGLTMKQNMPGMEEAINLLVAKFKETGEGLDKLGGDFDKMVDNTVRSMEETTKAQNEAVTSQMDTWWQKMKQGGDILIEEAVGNIGKTFKLAGGLIAEKTDEWFNFLKKDGPPKGPSSNEIEAEQKRQQALEGEVRLEAARQLVHEGVFDDVSKAREATDKINMRNRIQVTQAVDAIEGATSTTELTEGLLAAGYDIGELYATGVLDEKSVLNLDKAGIRKRLMKSEAQKVLGERGSARQRADLATQGGSAKADILNLLADTGIERVDKDVTYGHMAREVDSLFRDIYVANSKQAAGVDVDESMMNRLKMSGLLDKSGNLNLSASEIEGVKARMGSGSLGAADGQTSLQYLTSLLEADKELVGKLLRGLKEKNLPN